MIIEPPEELWKPLTYPGIRKNMYLVSNRGNIKNNSTGKILKGYKHCTGYIYINLMTDETPPKSYVFRKHRLVAWEHVNGYSEEKCYVNHIDGDKTNNQSYNLEWCTFTENIRHAFNIGLQKSRKGENNANAKLETEIVHIICKTIAHFNGDLHKTYDALVKTGISIKYSNLSSIKYKRIWSEISDMYFQRTNFSKNAYLSEEDVKLIQNKLILNKMKCMDVYRELKGHIPDLSIAKVYRVAKKMKEAA